MASHSNISAPLNELETCFVPKTISRTEKVVNKSGSGAANLVKLLPTTTVLAFQILSPSFTNGGHCYTTNQYLTGVLLACCGISCLIASFTDSYRSDDGKLYHGLATRSGLVVLNGEIKKTVELTSYKLRLMDFVHAVLSVLVFASVALMDTNVVNCYYPVAHENVEQLLKNIPLGVGFACSLFFMAFPTIRHGVGYASQD